MTKDEFTKKLNTIHEQYPELVSHGWDEYRCHAFHAMLDLQFDYIKSLENEIARTAGFLAVHNFPGYEFDDASKDMLKNQNITITYTTACSE